MKLTQLFFLVILFSHSVFGQIDLKGKVIDFQTREPLIGATVSVHELEKGVLTNIDGEFSFENIRPAHYHIHVSYIGYSAITLDLSEGQLNEYLLIEAKQTSLELHEIVVESNYYKMGPKEQTLSMEIIDADFMMKHRNGSFVSLLEYLPGVASINTGVGIAKPVIRGMSFNRVIVNDRGIKQEGQQWGGDHGLEIDMFDPSRVEVIKGPSSLMYGSDGLGGVINIFPPPIPQESISGSFQTLYKSNNHLIGNSVSMEGGKSDWVYRIRLSTQDFGDYQVPAHEFNYNGTIYPIYDGHLKNTAGKERNFSFMTGIKRNWGYSTLTVSNFNQEAGLFVGTMGSQGFYRLDPDGNRRNIEKPKQRTNHLKVISNTNVLVGKNWLEFDLGYQNNDRKEISDPHAGIQADSDQALYLSLQTFTLNARYFLSKHKDRSRIIGAQGQYQINKKGGFEHLIPDYRSSSFGVFIYEERSWFDKLTATGGFRLDYASRNINEYMQSTTDEAGANDYYQRNAAIQKVFFDYSTAIGVSYYPNQHWNAKLNVGTSYRVPTATELSINGIHHGTFRHELGEADLISERGVQGDLSISYQRTNFHVLVTPYISYYDDYIYLAPSSMFSNNLDEDAFFESTHVYQYKQHDVFFAGTEVSIEYHPVNELHWRSAFDYVYNYNFETFLPLPLTPAASLFTDIGYEFEFRNGSFKALEIGANARKVFDQNRVDRNEFTTEGYFLIGLSANTEVTLRKFGFDLFFDASNILDEKYFNHMSRYRLLNLPEQGRNYSVSVHIPI